MSERSFACFTHTRGKCTAQGKKEVAIMGACLPAVLSHALQLLNAVNKEQTFQCKEALYT